MGKLRVLVVEDSLTVRMRLVEALSADPDIEVVGQADDGKKALTLCLSLRPDVVTLDMVLPVLSGLAATEYIMAYCPTPILIVSASLNRGAVFKTFDALQAGAVDVLEKQAAHERDDEWNRRLVGAVKMVSRIKVITHPRRRLEPELSSVPGRRPPPMAFSARGPFRAVLLGASTGGPSAIRTILQGLPKSFPLPILVVLHLDRAFGEGLVDWLNGESPLRVRTVRRGEALPPVGAGEVLVAAPDHHLTVRGETLLLTQDAERHSCRPAVDVLFESAAQSLRAHSVGCLLTGMGRDGALGLKALREAGALTLAQDEASSTVFGMPKEAIELGAAERVLPLEDFAPALVAAGRLSS